MERAFIEAQFPVSKVSKESYKERMANNGQTLTGLGKWWGRKPLVLVRAALLGCLLPATDNPQMDNEIFLKLMSMDETGLMTRKDKTLSAADLYKIVEANKKLQRYLIYFDLTGKSPKLIKGAPREEIEIAAFRTLGYDAKISLCKRPEHVQVEDDQTWREINHYLGTSASSLQELVKQLSERRFGHIVRVGDCFCGGGSIPFEAARIGCDTYASDLNPIAGLLTWAAVNVCGSAPAEIEKIHQFQVRVFNRFSDEIDSLGVEQNEIGDRAVSYLYCSEAKCPECGHLVPLAPSWVIGKRTRTVARLKENINKFDIEVEMGASDRVMSDAANGTVTGKGMRCPCCGKTTSVQALRHDSTDSDGNIVYGLRRWNVDDISAKEDDVFQERLYAIKYEHKELLPDGKTKVDRYYRAPNDRDIDNEKKVNAYVSSHFSEWMEAGLVPAAAIESGYNTDQLIRERGWGYWHQLFNTRQLLQLCLFEDAVIQEASDSLEFCIGLLALNRMLNWNSRLCMWSSYQSQECGLQTFYNQAFNTFFNYSTRAVSSLKETCIFQINNSEIHTENMVDLLDARDVETGCDIWITDPPYADAVNYHELSEFFLSWDQKLLKQAFPGWYSDSKRVLAVRGDENFSQTMIDIYRNLTQHMPDSGIQIVMFTHSDPAVWAQLALIMWKAGLTVTAAWNVATETDAGGIYNGNYVKGTVLLVLRKQQGEEEAFLDELTADIKTEVKKQIESMQKLDDKEDPNFSDPDYVLAAYAASLKVLTSYKAIGEIDLDYELNLAINEPSRSEVVKLIERAKKIAYDFIIPTDFDNYLWRELSPSERFYIKGLESEKHGNYQVSTYQEYARGFGLQSYSQLMASERANTARLKTPSEFAMRAINDVPGFEDSILRIVLAAIHVAVKEEENPQMGLWHLKTTVPNYWDRRDMLKQLLSYLAECKDIDTMPHWKVCGEMASHMYTLVDNDRV